MTTAHLGLVVDSGTVTKATPELQKLTAAAGQAEVAADRLKLASSAGAAAQDRATTAAKMNTAALQAQAAAARMASFQQRNLAFQLNDVAVSLASGMNPLMVAMQQGSQIAQIYGAGEGGMGRAFAETGKMAGSLASRLLPLGVIVGALTVGFAAMTTEINRNAETQVSMGDVLTATWQLTAEAIMGYMQPAMDWLAGIWDYISPGINIAMNALIGSFDIAFRNIATIWNMLPGAIGDVAIQAANATLGGIEAMINGAIDLLNGFVRDANGLLEPLGMSMGGGLDHVTFSPFDNPFAGQDRALTDQMNKNASDVRAKTLAGGYTADIGARAQALARAKLEAEGAEKATKSLADNGFGKLIGMTNTFADATSSAFRNLGSGIIDAFKKGGDVASNFFTMILDRVGQVGESLLNTGLNALLDIGIGAIMGGIGGGLGSGAIGRGTYGGSGGFFPAFPGMASGGTVGRSGMSWVGENGPELLHLPRGAQVIPNAPSMAMAANQNGGGITIGTVNIQANSEREGAAAARGFASELRKHFPAEMERYQKNPLRRTG